MDIKRVPNDQKLYLCKFYFKVGFLFLPLVWAVNACWFYQEAFKKPAYEQQPQIRKYVIWSSIGAAIWAVIIISWIAIYQINRADWGKFADDISFIVPVGRA